MSEAVIFDRQDIMAVSSWELVRANLRAVAKDINPATLIFHFPVNDCNYVADAAVRDRLWEVLDFLADLGAIGLVLHSNQIMPVRYWNVRSLSDARARFRDFVPTLWERAAGAPFWIGLENMPIMGNDATESDPILVYPADFEGICAANVGITWDFCHFSYTTFVSNLLHSGRLNEHEYYPNLRDDQGAAMWVEPDRIVHTHFSSFRGLATVSKGGVCEEGVLPWESTLGEEFYARLIRDLARALPASTVTFEIHEHDYVKRSRFSEMVNWATRIALQDRR